jgi:hypothetical protein
VIHAIEAVEVLGIDPADVAVAPDQRRHVYNRLSASERRRRYTRSRIMPGCAA